MEVPIGIFNIGRTSVDKEEVTRWLQFLGVEGFNIPDGISDPALLVALAAKRCYKSFDTTLNPNLSRVRTDYADYLDNVLKSGHGSVFEHSVYTFAIENVSRVFCYHPSTEVLTFSGWKSVSELLDNELLLTLNPKTKIARWSRNKKLHSFDYSGPLYYWKNKEDESPKMTPEHTIWCCPMNQRKVRGLSAYDAMKYFASKIQIGHLLGKPFIVLNAIGNIENSLDPAEIKIGLYTYKADLLFEWLGLVATDGTIVEPTTGRHRVRVNQSKIHVIERLHELYSQLFQGRGRITGDAYKAFDISDIDLYEWVLSKIARLKTERDLSPLFLYSNRLIREFLRGAYAGDGCHGSNSHRAICCGGNLELAKQYQVLIAIAGLASKVTIRTDEIGQTRELKSGQKFVSQLPSIYVNEHRRGDGASQIRSKDQCFERYEGKVYCPETEDGLVYVRSNGKAVWCGNTAEMNRHRAGWAISEGSLRYIRFGECIPYWLPTCLQPNDSDDADLAKRKADSRQIMKDAFHYQEIAYRKLESAWDMVEGDHNFHYKKTVTSMMRRIVGMGVATGGVWSGNIRALRHVLAMRCSPAAEEEILHVFSRIAVMIKAREPLMFGDFYQEDGFWKPKYQKV